MYFEGHLCRDIKYFGNRYRFSDRAKRKKGFCSTSSSKCHPEDTPRATKKGNCLLFSKKFTKKPQNVRKIWESKENYVIRMTFRRSCKPKAPYFRLALPESRYCRRCSLVRVCVSGENLMLLIQLILFVLFFFVLEKKWMFYIFNSI